MATASAQAGDNWKASGVGTTQPGDGVDVDDFSATSSHLGRVTGEGYHVLNPVDFTFVGQEIWTAANGDILIVNMSGQIFPSGDPDFPYGFVAHLVIDGGTGRLANARGEGMMSGGFTGVPGDFYFDVRGSLHPQGK